MHRKKLHFYKTKPINWRNGEALFNINGKKIMTRLNGIKITLGKCVCQLNGAINCYQNDRIKVKV